MEDEFEPMMSFTPQTVQGMNCYELKEIRTYTANELFKAKSKTDRLYNEFTKIKKMKDELRNLQTLSLSTNYQFESMAIKLDKQFDAIRQQLARTQTKHEALRQLKKMLNDNLYSGLDFQIQKLYKKIRQGDELESDQLQKKLDQSMLSEISCVTSFSDASSTAQDRFMQKWQPIIDSGEYDSNFMNPLATWMLPQKERDFNLQEVCRLKKEISNLRLTRPYHQEFKTQPKVGQTAMQQQQHFLTQLKQQLLF